LFEGTLRAVPDMKPHSVWAGMGAAPAAISTLGLDLDLSKQRVLMRMRSSARRGAVMLAHRWPDPVMGQTRTQRKQSQDCGSYGGDGQSDGRKKKGECGQPDPCASIYSGVHRVRPLGLLSLYDAHRNGSIPIISREDCAKFFVNRLSGDLNSEFRSSATTKRHQVI
jgi:hypothetical protein